jgi:C_GCAxxG_C_C family probable redox protein
MDNKENQNLSGQAVEMFNKGFNCSQSIVATYGKKYGIDDKTALKIAAVFGGGMARLGETCGAVTGAFMTIGLKYAVDMDAKDKIFSIARQFAEEFKARNKCLSCRELLGYDINTPDGFKLAKEKAVMTNLCPRLVRDASEILEELFRKNP